MDLATDALVAFGALLISALVAYHLVRAAKRHTRLQEQLATSGLKVHGGEEERSKDADIHVTLERHPDSIVLLNVGESRALDVRLKAESHNNTGRISEPELRRRTPIPVLEPRQACAISAEVLWEHSPAFDIVVTWTDVDGTPQRLETVVYG